MFVPGCENTGIFWTGFYGYMEVGVREINGCDILPRLEAVLIVSDISILYISALRNLFRLLRTKMGLRRLLGFGTKNSRLKKPKDV